MMNLELQMKVCGMRDRNNILEVLRLEPAYMGFIFYPRSPRYVGNEFKIPEDFPKTTRRVGVFVNERNKLILEKVHACRLDFVQLHGNETAAQCRELKGLGVGIIKAFSVDDDMDFQSIKEYEDTVDYFLFDSKGKFYGGNAKTFDWTVLRRYDQAIPFFLSGGITPGHIQEIKNLDFNLIAIDVNSGVEIEPGFKDVKKIKAIQTILNKK